MRTLIGLALVTMSWTATAQENLVAVYNSCVTDEFMKELVIVGLPGWTNRRALDQAEGKCAGLLDRAYYAAQAAGTQRGADILESLTLNQIRLEKRLLSMFPEHRPGRK